MSVVLDISISLDGYVTGPDPDLGRGLGRGGEPIHNWVVGGPWSYDDPHVFAESGVDHDVLAEALTAEGTAVVGRRMFDHSGGWGGTPPFDRPMYVLSHRPAPDWLAPDSGFVFVSDGIESAVRQAREVAGEKNVGIGGGASVARQALRAGLVDELLIHLSPILIGSGTKLFDENSIGPTQLRPTRSIQSPYATHLYYSVLR